jgi:hypothetical protein
MTKEIAVEKTIKKFTNLLDGKTINVAVKTILDYYNSLLENKDMVVKSVSNIEQNFQEEEIQEMLEEADYWDGDETDKINY